MAKLRALFLLWSWGGCSLLVASLPAGCSMVSEAVKSQAEDSVFFIAGNGNDAWSGRLARPNFKKTDGPFATIPRARDAVRQLKKTGPLSKPVMVYLRGGTYTITETIRFTLEDSGTEACPVTYAAYRNEKPVLVGGRRITGFKQAQGEIVTTVLPRVKDGDWFFRQLFVDGKRMLRARTPNYDPSDPYRKGFFYVWRGFSGFGSTLGNIHNSGDWLEYNIEAAAEADYAFWMLYGADNKAFNLDDMKGRTVLIVDNGTPVPLMNLPNTGSWTAERWSCCATVRLTKGKHTFRWMNAKGGGLNIRGFVFCDDPTWKPVKADLPATTAGKNLIAVPADAMVKSHGKQICFAGNSDGIATAFRYRPGDVQPEWARAAGAEIHIFQSAQCRAFKEIVSVAAVDTRQNIVTLSGKECIAKLNTGDRYFVENVPDALDAPGEWYLDRATGELRLWPMQSLSAKTEVIAPAVGRIFELIGNAQAGETVSHIHFKGLAMRNTDYSPDDKCEGYRTGGDGVVFLGHATDCSVTACCFHDIGKYAVCVENGGTNDISGNNIAAGAEGGIVLLNTSGNSVSDNHIHGCGWVYKHVGGVILEGPKTSGNRVAHNLIHDMPRYGISLKNPGSRNVVEFNDLYNLSTETYDTGGIEVTQGDRTFQSGSVIRYNRVRDVIGYSATFDKEIRMSWAIYLDSFAGGYDVNNNITCRNSHGGFMLQGGQGNKVWNNIFVDSTSTQLYFPNFSDNYRSNAFERNIVYYSDPDAGLFVARNIRDNVMTADYNLYWKAGTNTVNMGGTGTFDDWQKRGLDTHSLIADPLFVDPSKDDYALQPGSPAFRLGFKALMTDKIGLLRDKSTKWLYSQKGDAR